MARGNSNRKSTKGQKRGPTKSYKDIVMAYTLEGMAAVRRLDNEGLLKNKKPLRSAIAEIEKHAPNHPELEDLRAFADEKFGQPGEGRGRTAPESGETRTYSAQQLWEGRKFKTRKDKDTGKQIKEVIEEGEPKGEPFLRLPLGVLGAKSGTKMKVSFNEDVITVTRA